MSSLLNLERNNRHCISLISGSLIGMEEPHQPSRDSHLSPGETHLAEILEKSSSTILSSDILPSMSLKAVAQKDRTPIFQRYRVNLTPQKAGLRVLTELATI